MSSEDYKRVKKSVLDILRPEEDDKDTIIEEHLIEETVDQLFKMRPQWIETVDKNLLVKDLYETLQVKITGEEIIFTRKVNKNHKPWLEQKIKEGKIEFKRFKRYKEYLEESSDIAPRSLAQIESMSAKILSHIEDPHREDKEWDVRGMVVGEVQAGKTANYIGLINRALDAGYKRIIILCGLANDLRSQTQERIEEGVTGRDNSQTSGIYNTVGVGKIDGYDDITEVQLTTTRDDPGDFNTNRARVFQPGQDTPVVLIVKKNVNVLENILLWIMREARANGSFHKDSTWDWRNRLIKDIENMAIDGDPLKTLVPKVEDQPLLLIDDECDQASIDTNPDFGITRGDDANPDHDPTLTNKLIRRILKAYDKSAYVGYTATPYSNVYISSKLETDREGDDIRPRDFIINLPSPSNYIGSRKIFSEDENLNNFIFNIHDYVDPSEDPDQKDAIGWMPPSHLMEHKPRYKRNKIIPPSLEDAVISFFIACAIRKLRGYDEGNSMLVHVSRYIPVSTEVADQIQAYVMDLESIIDGNEIYLSKIQSIWKNNFKNNIKNEYNIGREDVDFENIIKIIKQNLELNKTVVETVIGTAQSKKQYARSIKEKKNIIAVGGQRLSRGLTLKSLMISYFLRTAKNPLTDTMTQMGRWFGYRPLYDDLCKLYLTGELESNFREFAQRDYEFRSKIEEMNDQERTPTNYILMIETDPHTRLTSKRKSIYTTTLDLNFSNWFAQTIVLHKENENPDNLNKKNREIVSKLLTELGKTAETRDMKKNSYLWKNVESKKIIKFFDEYNFHEKNTKVHPESINYYIKTMNKDFNELKFWSVGLLSSTDPVSELYIHENLNKYPIKPFIRSSNNKENDKETHRIQTLSSTGHESFDLNEEEYNAANKKWKEEKKDKNESKRLFYRWARGSAHKENIYSDDNKNGIRPLLLIYPIIGNEKDDTSKKIPMIGLAISFPQMGQSDRKRYLVLKEDQERLFAEE